MIQRDCFESSDIKTVDEEYLRLWNIKKLLKIE